MAEAANKVVSDSLLKARQYYENRNYGRAFAHYLVVFQLLEPDARQQYEKEFATTLHLWGSLLHKRGKFDDVFRCYRLATTYFPNSVEIINNLGVHSLKLKCYSAAKLYFESALNKDPNFLPAEQNLQSARYALVERWHFPMLNDTVRNKSYAQAIFLEISHGFNNILDIGMGTGILSLFASKSKQCKSITACDYSDTMFEIATQVVEANNATTVKLVKKKSHHLSIPQDMKKKATLLVTEILDSGVFGENILDTLINAWDHLINPYPYGRVIPAAVSVYIAGIQSTEISRKSRYIPNERNMLNLNEYCLYYDTRPYDTENLKTTNYEFITDKQMCLFVDFNNILQLKTIVESSEQNPKITLRCLKDGRIDSFVIWFKLHLNDSITLTNDPEEQTETCWEQAVINFKHPIPSFENEFINVQMSCRGGVLGIANYETSIKIEAMELLNFGNHKQVCYDLTKEEIYFINDSLLLTKLEETSKLLLEHFKDWPILIVLDLNPFPILGLMLAKQGARVYCRINQESSKDIRLALCQTNNINEKNVCFIPSKYFNDYTSAEMRFDVIIQNVLSPDGLVNEPEIFQAQVMRYSLSKSGIYLPRSVFIWAQVVQCQWLQKATRVDDKNICGFKIGQFINEYKTTEQRDIKFNSIQHIELSEPIKLGKLIYDVTNPNIQTNAFTINKDGCADTIFYWYEVDYYEGVDITTRRDEAFVNNSAFVIDQPVAVKSGKVLQLNLKQHKGIIKIYVSEPD